MPWRLLLQGWLHSLAEEKLAEAVSQARTGGAEGPTHHAPGDPQPSADVEPAPPEPCDVGCVFALEMEQGGLEDLLSGVVRIRAGGRVYRQGGCRGRRVVVVESGIGAAAAAAATDALIEGHEPAWVISAGFAGGLAPTLQRNDVVLVNEIVRPGAERLAIDVRVSPEAAARVPGLHLGRLVTVDRAVADPAEKRSLAAAHSALAVDMESWAVADVCRRRKVRCLVVRVVSDTVDDRLPQEVENLARQGTWAGKLGAVAGAVWRRPSSVKDMYHLREQALLASDRLGKFLVGMIEQLPRRERPEA